ncbi:MAG: ATP-binding protein [Lachnospiraceae bacterium]
MIGRNVELNTLNEAYNLDMGTICVLYGREGMGKTTLLKEYTKDKQSLWFYALPGSEKEQKRHFIQAVTAQTNRALMNFTEPDDTYEQLLINALRQMSGRVVLVIEDFIHLIKASDSFFTDIVKTINNKTLNVRLQVILTTSSIYFVENNLVSAVGSAAMYINSFIKLRAFSFVETVRMFPQYGVEDIIRLYAITGGVPGYLACFVAERSLKDNIINEILKPEGKLHLAGYEFVKNELRETGVYNTILAALASGREKLNDIYEYTGYGRDKISVYIKHLMERDIVEKLFSYDSKGYVNSKKGLYRINDSYVYFWYRFIYGQFTALTCMDSERFYERFIQDDLEKFASDAFVMVGQEYLELLGSSGGLQFNIARKGSWYGKNGDVDIIAEGMEGTCLIGKTNSTDKPMTQKDYEELLANAKLAGITPQYVYLFSLGGFTEELRIFSEKNMEPLIKLIGMEDL